MLKLWRFAVIFILLFCFHINNIYANEWVRAKSLDKIPGVDQVMVKKKLMNNETIELDYSIPEPELKKCADTGLYPQNTKEIFLGNAPNRKEEGKPVLPVIPVKLIIPAGRDLDSVKVIPGKKKQLSGKFIIKHGQKPIPLKPGSKFEPTLSDKAVYASDNQYPNSLYEVVGVQRKRGVAILFVNLNPISYRPLSGKVSYYDILTLHVKTKPAKARKSTMRYRPDPSGRVVLTVDNPDMIESYGNEEVSNSPMILNMINPDDTYEYVVITNEAIRDATTNPSVSDFIAHKQALGLTTTVVTIESILSTYSGVDDAQKLRNFIIDAYNNWETDYVLLGGDTNIIPLRSLHNLGASLASDLYYQCLDGDYDSDGDYIWGEQTDGPGGTDVDLMAEVYIGRASAENADEMSNFIYKTIAYENESASEPYLEKILIAGEYLGPQFGPDEFGYAMPYMEEIRNGSDTSGYTTLGLNVNPDLTIETLYDYDLAPDSWSKNEIIDKINSNNYSIINHLGHASWTYVMKFENGDADALTNDKYFFSYSHGCLPGLFPVDCIAEHLTTSHRHGAFAVVFNSHYGWGAYNDSYDTMDGPSQRFNRQFWDAYFGEGLMNLGVLNADSHEDNIWDINGNRIRWCYYITNLFGDPALRLKTPRCDYLLHDLTLYGDDLAGEEYRYISECSIIAGPNLKIETDAVVTFQAAEEIVLNPEFEAEEGCKFIAEIQ